jgi:hypothetical protein
MLRSSSQRKEWRYTIEQPPPNEGGDLGSGIHRKYAGNWPIGPVMAVRRRRGQLLALIREWGRWYPVESVRIENAGHPLLS